MDWAFALVLELRTSQVGAGLNGLRDALSSAPWPDVDTWGRDEKAQRQAAAVADLIGGPAPLREED